jgi:hypothetical protein
VTLDLGDPIVAPPEVHRIRGLYRPLITIDDQRADWRDQTIAGYFLADDVLHLYLLDGADPEIARAKAEQLLLGKLPPGGIEISRLESPPSSRQLEEWIDEARPARSAAGVILYGASGGCCNVRNRVRFMVGTAYSTHLLREALTETSLPQEGALVEIPPRPRLEEPSQGAVRAALELDEAVQSGSALRIEATWTNVGDTRAEFTYSPVVPANIVVFSEAGELAWASYGGGPIIAIGAGADLAPGEELRFARYWDLTDVDGFALPPGDYLVQAQEDVHELGALTSEVYPLGSSENSVYSLPYFSNASSGKSALVNTSWISSSSSMRSMRRIV